MAARGAGDSVEGATKAMGDVLITRLDPRSAPGRMLKGESLALLAGETEGRDVGTGGGGIMAADLDEIRGGFVGRLGPA